MSDERFSLLRSLYALCGGQVSQILSDLRDLDPEATTRWAFELIRDVLCHELVSLTSTDRPFRFVASKAKPDYLETGTCMIRAATEMGEYSFCTRCAWSKYIFSKDYHT